MTNTTHTTAPQSAWLEAINMMWRQWRWDVRDVARQLPAEQQHQLSQAVTASELGHTGQIRVVVESSLPVLACLALREAGMTKATLIRERAIEVVADRAVSASVAQADWDALVGEMSSLLARGHTQQALQQAIAHVDVWLRRGFAHDVSLPASPNELPDAVIIC